MPEGKKTSNRRTRPDRNGPHRSQFEANRKIIFATQTICGVCGKPVDFSLKYPDPYSPTVDHIIPISKNGDPSALENLQLAHRICNRLKSNKLYIDASTPSSTPSPTTEAKEVVKFPLSFDWRSKSKRRK